MDQWEFSKEKQREEVVAARSEADDWHLSFILQMEEAKAASLNLPVEEAIPSPGTAADLCSGEVDDSAYTDLLLDDLKRLDEESKDRLLAQEEMCKAMGEVDVIVKDSEVVASMKNLQLGKRKPCRLLQSSTTWKSQTSRIYSKGLVSEEIVKDDDKMLGGFGVSICDTNDNPRLEMNKVLGDEVLEQPQAAELAAIIHGLTWALEVGLEKVIFFCDDSDILDYVTGKVESQESTISTLVEQVALLQSRFSYCEAKSVRKDITSVVKLARDAIASQTRFHEGDVELETCRICCNYVEPHQKYEVRGCFHRFCHECMRSHLRTRLDLGKATVECPSKDCKVQLRIEDCASIADRGRIDIMIRREKEATIKVLDRVYCPNPTCSTLMSQRSLLKSSKEVFADAGESGARKCQNCNFCFCVSCKDKWHYGMTCENFLKTSSYKASAQANFEDAARRNGWKKCGQCTCVVELAEGCKHMTCWSCGYEFCYSCGEPWVKKKPTCRCPFRVNEG